MSEQHKDEQVPGGTLEGNQDDSSSDGDSGPHGARPSSPEGGDAPGDDENG
jgi:hypothetical protein